MQRVAAKAALAPLLLLAGQVRSDVTIGDLTFTHSWVTKASMPAARSDMTVTTVGDKIYLIGGCISDQQWTISPDYSYYGCGSGLASAVTGSVAVFLPLSNGYETNVSDAPRARYRHAAAAVGGSIYLFGGTDGVGNIVPEVDVLDVASGSWTTLATSMPNPTTDLTAFQHGDLIYVAAGYTAEWEAVTRVQVFDPELSGSAAWSEGPSLKQGRGDVAATMVGDSAYVVGGFHHSNWDFPLDEVERLDLGINGAEWSVRQEMDIARGDKAVAALNGLVHVIGGETKNDDGHSVALKDVEVYDPESNQWFVGGSIPSDRFRFSAAAHGSSIFVFGGQGYLVGDFGTAGSHYPVLATVEEYVESVSDGTTDVNAARRADLYGSAWAVAAIAAAVAAVRGA